ncbi:MAG: ROK family glucokinase [Ruminococcaceae bacterium]|nr:ROK family glucokinase [Oscillospiraceae bacterium]
MYYIGVDLGGTNIAVGIVDENMNIVKKGKVPTHKERHSDEIIADMGALCDSLVKEAGLTFADIAYVGVAAPGSVDPANGTVKYANNINMFHYPLAERLMSHIPVKKVYLENDANAAALAEAKAGAGKGYDDVIMVTLGTGVGGGIVIGGKLYSGFNYAGAELGHIVIEHGGRPCTCGRKGCWEAYSSATALIEFTKEKMTETRNTVMWELCENGAKKVSGRTAFKAARAGDKAGQEVVDTYIDYLACGITNMVNIFQPQVLCIGGGVCGEGDYLLAPLKEIVDRDQYGSGAHDDKTQIKIAQLGNDAGILGAALLGI